MPRRLIRLIVGGGEDTAALKTATAPTPMTLTQHCPHCASLLGEDHRRLPVSAERCSKCRLVIGAGRAIDHAGVLAMGRNSSAGQMLRSSALRAGSQTVEALVGCASLRRVAADLGIPTERLRMTDYDEFREHAQELPTLSELLATFGSWKRARTAAVRNAAPLRTTPLTPLPPPRS